MSKSNNIYSKEIADGILYSVLKRKPDMLDGTYEGVVGSVMVSLSDKEIEGLVAWAQTANRKTTVGDIILGNTNIKINAVIIK
jgi:hypothetical protein